MTEKELVKKKANRYFFSKVILNAMLMVIGAVMISLFLRGMQHQSALYKQQINNMEALNETVEILNETNSDAEEIT